MDWFPTFMKLSQARLPDNRILDGCDLTDIILKKGKRANEEFFFFQGARISACRSGDYKLILPDALRKGNQYVPDVPAHDTLLFNLRKDIGETTNLVKTNPAKVEEMSYNLDEFRISLRGLKGKAGEPRPKDWPR
jgi:arylsulfatase A-like enzyme